MGMQINHNIAALNAWRSLGISSSHLSGSLEKLSSGYRINRGSDDPAGLLISEKLRAQVAGLDQAMSNANDAISMVQTAEGALTEMNNMLNSIRTLAVHAANTGSNDTTSIGADQTAVDKAVDSIQRIATTTQYAGKNLLDGSAGTSITIKNTSAVEGLTTGAINQSGLVNVQIDVIACQAIYENAALNVSGTVFSQTGIISLWTTNCGTAAGIATYSVLTNQTTVVCITAMINSDSSTTGIWASAVGVSSIGIYSCDYGDHISLHYVLASALVDAAGNVMNSDAGVDVSGLVGGDRLSGSGFVLYGSTTSSWKDTEITVASGYNAVTTYTNALSVVAGNLSFALTDDAATADLVSYTIADMRAANLGVVGTLSGSNLTTIKSSTAYALGTQAADAVSIIDQAITDVSNERAKLGAFQKYTLETTINNLGVTKENLVASESRIRDVDMAAEMMQFTKNQILVQAGTAMLAQANQLPQAVLQLLGGR